MRKLPVAITALFLMAVTAPAQSGGEKSEGKKANPLDSIAWTKGPATGRLKDQASVKIPEGYVFADGEGAKKFLELTENFPSGREYGMFAPADFDWFVIFTYNDGGYVKDDEKTSLDAEAILKNIREGTEESNEERRKRGWDTMQILGWKQAPHFNDKTKNLEWATEAKSSAGGVSINFNTRYLGRGGYMSVVFVGDPKGYDQQLALFRQSMDGFAYNPETSYAAFKPGDKVAEYGLTALIVGGGAAVAAKSGLLKSLWKFIVIGIAALGGFVKKLFTGRKSEPEEPAATPTE